VPKEETTMVSDLRYGWKKLRKLATDVSDNLTRLQVGANLELAVAERNVLVLTTFNHLQARLMNDNVAAFGRTLHELTHSYLTTYVYPTLGCS
jgi:hypothetical protein